MAVDLEAPFAPHSSFCLKLHMSLRHVTVTLQLRLPAMHWKPGIDFTPEFADEMWSGIASLEPRCAREQVPCSLLYASVVFHTFHAISSILQSKIQTWLQRLSAHWRLRHDKQLPPDRSTSRPPHWLETTRCGRPRFRKTSITGRHSWRDAVTSESLARWWHTASARLVDCAAVSKSSYTGAQVHLQNIFKLLRKLQVSKEMTLGE